MKNTITDLNNYLFEQIESLNDKDLKGEELDEELTKCGIAIARSITAVRDAKKRRNRDEC